MTKISVFSGKVDQPARGRKKAIATAARIAKEKSSDLLILPGWSISYKKSSIEDLNRVSSNYQIQILGEVSKEKSKSEIAFYLFVPNSKPAGPFCQLFATSKEADSEVDLVEKIVQKIVSGERGFTINSQNFCLLICGENNFIRNIQSENNRPIVRHDISFEKNYDAIVNPSHVTMGNWGKLHARFSFLSEGGRYLIYTTNNKTASWKSAICIYYNGKHILSGDGIVDEVTKATYDRYDDWIMVTFPFRNNIG